MIPIAEALLKLSGGGARVLQGHRLLERLQKHTGMAMVEIREELESLRRQGRIRATDWIDSGHPHGRVWVQHEPRQASPTEDAWAEVLAEAAISDEDRQGLYPLHAALDGFERDRLAALIDGLCRLRADIDAQAGRPRFEVSARYLLGAAKLLDTLPRAALRRFGIAPERFGSAGYGYVMMAGPPAPKVVVLVENPGAFETAISIPQALSNVGWLCTFGYGLPREGHAYGHQLAAAVAAPWPELRPLIRAGKPPSAPGDWLDHPQVYFWGDLDRESLYIFADLEKCIPALRLSALYHPMIRQLYEGGAHPYAEATGKATQRSELPGVEIPDLLKQALASDLAVDQESVEGEAVYPACLEAL